MTNTVYDWNTSMDKWISELVFLVLVVIPVYGITLFIDAVILNSIEFWTGSNPMSMNEGDMEQQVVVGKDGNSYEITATQNRFDVLQLSGDNAGTTQAMIYNPENKSWSHEKDCEVNKVFQYSSNGQFVSIFAQDGRVATIPADMTDKSLALKMVEDQFASQTCMN